MKLYINELAPWERKNEYIQNIRFEKDIYRYADSIDLSLKQSIRQQLINTDRIVISHEKINDGIDQVISNLSSVKNGIAKIGALFEWGFTELVWQIEQNREYLIKIVEVLSAPLDTQAKERKNRAAKQFAQGNYEDAEEEFLASEKLNKFDFTVHISLGIIYLFHIIDKNKALDYFKKAVKYAKHESNYYASLAYMHLGLTYRSLGQMIAAESSSLEAIELFPDMIEAHYNNAQYNAILNRDDKAIAKLKEVIKRDRIYAVKCVNDVAFENIKPKVIETINQLIEEQLISNGKLLEIAKHISAEFREMVSSFPVKIASLSETINPIDAVLTKYNVLVERHSYFDVLDGCDLLKNIPTVFWETGEELKAVIVQNKTEHSLKINKAVEIKDRWLKPIRIITGIVTCSAIAAWIVHNWVPRLTSYKQGGKLSLAFDMIVVLFVAIGVGILSAIVLSMVVAYVCKLQFEARLLPLNTTHQNYTSMISMVDFYVKNSKHLMEKALPD